MKTSIFNITLILFFISISVKGAPAIEVTNNANSGPGSLRQAIEDIDPMGTITFSPSILVGIITLKLGDTTLGPLVINKSVTIDASSRRGGIEIVANSNRDFVLDPGETHCLVIDDSNNATKLNVSMTNIIISGGFAEGNNIGANIHNRENLTLTNCIVTNGRVNGGSNSSGGIYNDGGSLSLTDCMISGNQSEGEANGGGINSSGGQVDLDGCAIFSNSIQGAFATGGGIHVNGPLNMTDCTVSFNLAQGSFGSGGGIFIRNGSATLMNCTVSGNRTLGNNANGGGIFSGSLDNQTARLINCTIDGNSASMAIGGGIYNGRGHCELSHCTITNNSASKGDGIGNSGNNGTLTSLTASVVRDNSGEDLGLTLNNSPNNFESGGFNFVGVLGPNVAGFINGVNGDLVDTTTALNIARLGRYGGLTRTRPPLPGSPLINAAGSVNPGGTDQRGFARFYDGALDIGAVEFQNIDEALMTFDDDSDNDGISNGVELATGTDPFMADFGDEKILKIISTNDLPSFTFGYDPAFRDVIRLKLTRSTDLISFPVEVITSDSLSGFPAMGRDQQQLMLMDSNPPVDNRAFYRLEAVRKAP